MINDIFIPCAKCGEPSLRTTVYEAGREIYWRHACACGTAWILVSSPSEFPRREKRQKLQSGGNHDERR